MTVFQVLKYVTKQAPNLVGRLAHREHEPRRKSNISIGRYWVEFAPVSSRDQLLWCRFGNLPLRTQSTRSWSDNHKGVYLFILCKTYLYRAAHSE